MSQRFVNIHAHQFWEDAIYLPCEGIHPWDAGKDGVHIPEKVGEGILAVGEIGLDFCHRESIEAQKVIFREQLSLAEKQSLPVVIHCVKAFQDTVNILKDYHLRAVIFHGYIGSTQQAQQALRRGYYLSFGERTFASPKTIEALRQMPLEQLFLETDTSPIPIEEIYKKVAPLKQISVEELRCRILKNYEKIFGYNAR